MSKKFRQLFLTVSSLLLTVIFLGAFQTPLKASSSQINVVTTLDFYGEAAKAVLGDHGTVMMPCCP